MRQLIRPFYWVSLLSLLIPPAVGAGILDQSYDPGMQSNLDYTVSNNPSGNGFSGNFIAVAQTFKVGRTGFLSEVDVKLAYNGATPVTPPHPLTLRVLATANGQPSLDADAVLAAGQIPFLSVPNTTSADAAARDARFVPVVLSDGAPVSVTRGEALAIVLSDDTPEAVVDYGGYTWVGTVNDKLPFPYAGGTDFNKELGVDQSDLSWLTTGPWFADSIIGNYYDALGFRTYVSLPEPATVCLALVIAPLVLVRRRRSCGR